ncbi:MAG TPA: RNA 2',3'-cyclic phosphodiesterase [Bacteroidia bacterium]|nr:RNA 2',3'-cyclic phosphodiesterase [Bacteroidia bacterium]HNS12741.1 RNA 2',3'-cyclic phosphodiesterase [Bacteroidia bacterium]
MKDELIRVFVAFPVPENFLIAFREYSQNTTEIPGLRWTREANLHLTLFFIGEIGQEDLAQVKGRLNSMLSSFIPFELEFDKISFRGKLNTPSMIWAQFKVSENFRKLFIRIHTSMENLMTIKVQHTDPIPHVTLARLKKGVDLYELKTRMSDFPLKIIVDRIELWKTVHSNDGVIYNKIFIE